MPSSSTKNNDAENKDYDDEHNNNDAQQQENDSDLSSSDDENDEGGNGGDGNDGEKNTGEGNANNDAVMLDSTNAISEVLEAQARAKQDVAMTLASSSDDSDDDDENGNGNGDGNDGGDGGGDGGSGGGGGGADGSTTKKRKLAGSNKNDKKLTPEQKARKRRLRAKTIAKERGYHLLGTLSGFSSGRSSDVISAMLTNSEVAKLCRYVPKIPNKPAYDSFDEFKERLDLSVEAITPACANVIGANLEAMLRNVVLEATLSSYKAGRTRVGVNEISDAISKFEPSLEYSYEAPLALIRHAQVYKKTLTSAPALGIFADDEATIKEKEMPIVKQQQAYYDKFMQTQKEKKEAKAAAAAAKKQKGAAAAAAS